MSAVSCSDRSKKMDIEGVVLVEALVLVLEMVKSTMIMKTPIMWTRPGVNPIRIDITTARIRMMLVFTLDFR